MKRTYKIADITFSIIDNFSIPIYYQYAEDFMIENNNKEQFIYHFIENKDCLHYLDDATIIAITHAFHVFQKGNIEYRVFFHDNYYFAIQWKNGNNIYIEYIDESIILHRAKIGGSPFSYLCLERPYIEMDTIFLHSSFIKYKNMGIVFTAPSGTGKSTQAELWKKYADALIINGDRTALKKEADKWHAYGLPMCGTSNIHENDNADLKAIIVLRQASENSIRKLKMAEAFRLIYSEISVNNWDTTHVQKAMNLVECLISKIPVYMYKCTKEPEAVYYLKKHLSLM